VSCRQTQECRAPRPHPAGRHPVTQQAFKAQDIHLDQQQQECRVRWQLGEISCMELVENMPVVLGKSLHPHQRTLTAQDREDRHQQHPPLGKAATTARPAVRQRLEEADQIACSGWRSGEIGSQGASAVPAHTTARVTAQPGMLGQTSNRPCVGSLLQKPSKYTYVS